MPPTSGPPVTLTESTPPGANRPKPLESHRIVMSALMPYETAWYGPTTLLYSRYPLSPALRVMFSSLGHWKIRLRSGLERNVSPSRPPRYGISELAQSLTTTP